MLSRRALLVGGGGVGVGAAGLVGVSLLPPAPRQPRQALRALNAGAFSILAAVADRVCPGGGGLPTAWELEVPERIDTLLDRLHPGAAGEIAQALWLLENPVAGTALDGRMARFTQCDPVGQDAALQAWSRSTLAVRRTAYQALTGLIRASYWADPRTWPFAGYPGPPRFGPSAEAP